MKTLPALAFIAALVAFFFLPFDFETGLSALFGAGLATILISDYSRRLAPMRFAPMAAVTPLPRPVERFRLAA